MKLHAVGALVFAAMLALVGIFGLHGELLGGTAGSAFAHGEKVVTSPAEAGVSEETGQSQETAVSEETGQSQETAVITEYVHPSRMPAVAPERIDAETLWLARCIYSETKRPEEQELVAWVVRNRVETEYRGRSTYRSVVLDPYQFSAFNAGSRKRQYYSSLTPKDDPAGWQRALNIAHFVRHADSTLRPFSHTTRHFYSERSMVNRRHPEWSHGKRDVRPDRGYTIAKERFRFFNNVL